MVSAQLGTVGSRHIEPRTEVSIALASFYEGKGAGAASGNARVTRFRICNQL